jgi:glycosyltransferase involved in cell wall biosynthesis
MSKREDNRITVLLPINDDRFLAQTLQSINQQTLGGEHFNLLAVVDSGARVQDIQKMMLSNITKLSWKVIETANTGIVGTLNTGLNYSETEFVARIDQDDLMFSNRLEIQLDYLQKNPEILCVGGQIELIDQFGVHLGFSYFPKSQWLISKTITLTSPMAHPSVMFRRTDVLALGGSRSTLPEDWDLWLRLYEAGKISNLDRLLVRYRVHPNQLSRTKLYQSETARQLIQISRSLRENGEIDKPSVDLPVENWIRENSKLINGRARKDTFVIKLWIIARKLESLLLHGKHKYSRRASDY